MVRLQAVSIGPALDIHAAAAGFVHSVFPHAVNIAAGDDLWTVLASGKPDLPFGMRVALDTLSGLDVRTGDAVHMRGGYLALGTRAVVDGRSAPQWHVPLPTNFAAGLDLRLAAVARAAAPRAWCESGPMAHDLAACLARNPGALNSIVARVLGQGPGLTPAGDDVLTGILAVLAIPRAGGGGVRDGLARSIQARLWSTTSLSGHMLRQAIGGHFSRPLRRLLHAVAATDTPAGLNCAIADMLDIGATSGADTCMGIVASARAFLVHPAVRQAA